MKIWISEGEWYPCYDIDEDKPPPMMGKLCEITEEAYGL